MVLREGDVITVDGVSGCVLRGNEVPTHAAGSGEFFSMVMTWADRYKRMHVQATANSVEDVRNAKALGAEGIGMLRTESMFTQVGCIDIFRQAMLARTPDERCTFLSKLVTAHQQQFEEVFRLMDHRPVSVRLLDIPLKDVFPDPESADFDKDIQVLAERLGFKVDETKETVLQLQDGELSLGRKGRRLSALYPEIVIMQTKAIVGESNMLHTYTQLFMLLVCRCGAAG